MKTVTKKDLKKEMEKAYRQPRLVFGRESNMLDSTEWESKKKNKVEIKLKDNGDVCAYLNWDEVWTVSKGSFLDFVTSMVEKDDEEEDIMEDVSSQIKKAVESDD